MHSCIYLGLGVCKIANENRNPYVGVFVSSGVIQYLNSSSGDIQNNFRFAGLYRASRKTGVPVYFFSVNDVNFAKRTVKGTLYNSRKGTWERKTFPLPDIFYDRCGGITTSQWERALRVRKRITRMGIQKLNAQHYFDKWDLYKKLREVEQMRPYLPVTRRFRDQNDLKDLLKISDKVYLKSVNGSRGEKVMRLEKLPGGRYEYSYFVERLVIGRENSFDRVYRIIRRFFKGNKVIVQQAIPLLKINNRIVDFRAELQRNKLGELEIVGICARVGRKQSPITIHSDAYPLEHFLQNELKYSDEQIMQARGEVEKFLFMVYHSMEKFYGPFGEIGIDLGIDNKGKIWFIECNAKSAKVSLNKAYDRETVQKAFINPLEYARYLYTGGLPKISGLSSVSETSEEGEPDRDEAEVYYGYSEDSPPDGQ